MIGKEPISREWNKQQEGLAYQGGSKVYNKNNVLRNPIGFKREMQ